MCAHLPDALSAHGEGLVLRVILIALHVSADAIRHVTVPSHGTVFEGLLESGEGLNTCLFIYSFFYSLIHLFIYSSIYLFICLFIYLFVCLFVCLFI